MNKIVVEVQVPAINKVYDARIPRDIQVWEVTKLISQMIATLEPGMYSMENQAVLCDCETGSVLDINKLVDDAGLVNGSRVVLM